MEIERLLGANEKMAWLLDQAAPMNFIIVARIEGELNSQAVKDSLAVLIQIHPLLATHIEQRNDGPWVVTDDKLKPAVKILERGNDEHWQVEAEKEINAPFDCYGGLLFRVTLLNSPHVNELLLTFYHPISDANSGVYALRDLLTLVGNWKPGVAPVIPPGYPVRPSVEELLPPAAHGWSRFYKTVTLLVKQAVNNFSRRPRQLSVVDTPRKQRYTRIIHTLLPQETTDQFIVKCREHNTTIQGGLSAALLLAIARKIEAGARLTLICCSIVNLRKQLCPPLGDEIGFLASGAITAHRLRPTPEFWALAREIKRGISRVIDTGEIYVTLTLVGNLIPKNAPPDAFADKITEVFPYATLATNLGKVEIPEHYGSIKLTQLHFAVSLKSLAGKEFNLAAATFAGQMHLNFLYTAPNLADEIAKQLANDAIAILKENL